MFYQVQKAQLVINQAGAGKFSGFGSDKEVSFEITATQAGDNSYHAAQSVSRTIKIKKPSKSVFFEERKQDARYDSVKNDALTDCFKTWNIRRKALALFNSDSYDSDETVFPTLLNNAFGGDSLGKDSREAKPTPIDKNDGNQYIGFNRYDSTYQADMRIEYIVEQSSDMRSWSNVTDVAGNLDSTTDLGGGMERVVYKTTNSNKYIRVRVKKEVSKNSSCTCQ